MKRSAVLCPSSVAALCFNPSFHRLAVAMDSGRVLEFDVQHPGQGQPSSRPPRHGAHGSRFIRWDKLHAYETQSAVEALAPVEAAAAPVTKGAAVQGWGSSDYEGVDPADWLLPGLGGGGVEMFPILKVVYAAGA